jgi:uncharacterized protein (DUF2252 family)
VRDPIVEFQQYNQEFACRNPELLRQKVQRMAESPFAFFRGTFHLFAKDIVDRAFEVTPLGPGAEAELGLVGDIHTENYGTFKADDGLVHYDINDFDETTTGRFDFDVRRLTASLILTAQDRKDNLEAAVQTALAGLHAYTETIQRLLKKGRDLDLDVSEQTPASCAAVDGLIHTTAGARRPVFIGKLTEVIKGQRRLVRSVRYFNLPDNERAQALRLLEDYRQRMPPPPGPNFYDVQDVCGRISGIGSMGRYRYVVLVSGKGNDQARNVLLEFKEARPSAYDLYRQRQLDRTAWKDRAQQVITFQQQAQVASNARLGWAVDNGQSFQVRELGPHDERVDFARLKSAADLQEIAHVQASILARVHARSSARGVGVANPLAELGEPEVFLQRVLAFALAYADQARRDWKRFVGQRSELEDCAQWAGKVQADREAETGR